MKIIRTRDVEFPDNEKIDENYRGKKATVVCSYEVSDFNSITVDGAELTGAARQYASKQLKKMFKNKGW